MNNTTLAVQHVSFGYDNYSAVLNDITFHAEAGASIGLVGANGVGKSTLLKLLVGLHLPTSGSVQLNDWAVEPKNLPQIREKIGYVFQDSDSQLFMSTAYEDIAFAPRNYGLSKKEVDARVNHALDAIGIQYLRDKQIYKMSGGEKAGIYRDHSFHDTGCHPDGRTVHCTRSAQPETADSIVKFFFSDKNYRVSRFGYDFRYL